MNARADLGWARARLIDAEHADTAQARRQACLLAARHAGHALLASGRGQSPVIDIDQLWGRLAAELPGFAEWASYFMLVEGRPRLNERQSDDLLRDVTIFCDLVGRRLAGPREARARHG